MTKIQGIQPDYQIASKLSNSQTKFAHQQSFGSGIAAATNDTDKIIAEVTKQVDNGFKHNPVKRAINFFSKLFNEHDSEIQNQLINAAFTTTLAPAFIAWNPFSKQDDKTKQYTALRQPISAIIAIAGGVTLTDVFNRYMSKIGSDGDIASIDCRLQPDSTYLESQFHKEYKQATDKQKFLASCKPDASIKKEFADNGKPKGNYKKACISGYVKNVHASRKQLFTKLISEDPNNIRLDEKTGIISIVDAKTGKVLDKNIGQNIPHLTTQNELKEYIQKNNLHKRTLGDFMKERYKFEFYEDGTIKPSTVKEKVDKVNAMNFLREIGLVGDNTKGTKGLIDEQELQRILAQTRQGAKTHKQVSKVFGHTLQSHNVEILLDAVGQQASRMDQLQAGANYSKEEKITLGQLFDLLKRDNETIEDLMKQNVSSVLDKFSKPFISKGNSHFNLSAKLSDFAGNILTGQAAKAGTNFKNFNKYAGIFFNLFATAITCTALNWVYPRIVERLFPGLVKPDKPQESQAQPEVQKGGNK